MERRVTFFLRFRLQAFCTGLNGFALIFRSGIPSRLNNIKSLQAPWISRRQIFANLFLGETGDINGLRLKKFGIPFLRWP
jgi:hypothetical protein